MPTRPKRPGSRRLLLWYPRDWRDRYGDEFAELLIAEQAEQGPSWRRAVNVAATGLRARLAGAGLAGHPLDPAAAARAGLATFASCAAVSGLVGAVMWAQLAIGLQWSVPDDHRITQAMDLMSGALLVLAVLTVLAAVPVAWAAMAAVGRGAGRQLRWPAALAGAGTLVLIVGGRHFANGWPGTGGHLLVHQGLVPGGVAAFGWAATMWITSYWGHPGMLAAFPAAQLAWMVASPVATGCVVTGAVRLLRRVELSPRALRYPHLGCLHCLGRTGCLPRRRAVLAPGQRRVGAAVPGRHHRPGRAGCARGRCRHGQRPRRGARGSPGWLRRLGR